MKEKRGGGRGGGGLDKFLAPKKEGLFEWGLIQDLP